MVDISTQYLGLKLKNPIVVGSSGLVKDIAGVKKMAAAGAGAIVLKSLFEEQINAEVNNSMSSNTSDYAEAADYLKEYIKDKSISDYLNLITEAKKEVDIPIIASINCISASEWVSFAEKIQQAGADALELNVSVMPFNENASCSDNERVYFDVIEKVRERITIPLSLKISNYSSGLAKLIQRLSWTGDVQGIVMFNRHYSPDIDIEKMQVTVSNVFSDPAEYSMPLRWIALLSDKVECDLIATTGIHEGTAVIKQILAGASAVQVVSAIYKNGESVISEMVNTISKWMENKGYTSLEDCKGLMAQKEIAHNKFERIQFMKYYGGHE